MLVQELLHCHRLSGVRALDRREEEPAALDVVLELSLHLRREPGARRSRIIAPGLQESNAFPRRQC